MACGLDWCLLCCRRVFPGGGGLRRLSSLWEVREKGYFTQGRKVGLILLALARRVTVCGGLLSEPALTTRSQICCSS